MLLARTVILPALTGELKDLEPLYRMSASDALQRRFLRVSAGFDEISEKTDALEKLSREKRYECYADAMKTLRASVDEMEKLVTDEYWRLPKYREMLFVY